MACALARNNAARLALSLAASTHSASPVVDEMAHRDDSTIRTRPPQASPATWSPSRVANVKGAHQRMIADCGHLLTGARNLLGSRYARPITALRPYGHGMLADGARSGNAKLVVTGGSPIMTSLGTRTARCIALPLALCFMPSEARSEDWEFSPESGLRWTAASPGLELHAGGVFSGDLMFHETSEHPDNGPHAMLAKPIVEGRYDRVWRFRIAGDLLGTRTPGNFYEAFAAWEGLPWLRISAGLMPLPLGLEAGFYPEDLPMFAHSFSYFIDYASDWALRAEGQHGEGIFEWDAAYGFGAGFDANGRSARGPQALARFFTRPMRSLAEPDASSLARFAGGIFLGVGYVRAWDWDGELIVRSPVGMRLFDSTSFEADYSKHLSLTVGVENGPVRVFWEKTSGGYYDAETPAGTVDLDDQTTSWQATAAWMITGQPYDGRIFGQHQVAPPGPNAWEVTVRYANGDIDRDFFQFGLTDSSKSSQEFRSFTATLNWYATPNLRLSLGFMTILADDDDDVVVLENGGGDTAGVFRAQYRF